MLMYFKRFFLSTGLDHLNTSYFQKNIFLLSPWLIFNSFAIILEIFSFFYLLGHSRVNHHHLLSAANKLCFQTDFSPISAFTFSIAFIVLMVQVTMKSFQISDSFRKIYSSKDGWMTIQWRKQFILRFIFQVYCLFKFYCLLRESDQLSESGEPSNNNNKVYMWKNKPKLHY